MIRTWTADDARGVLHLPTPDDDKYSRGVVGLRTGSREYPGAAVLGVEAAWRAGVGMVRYIGPKRVRHLVLERRPETVVREGRVHAWVVGSGSDAARRSNAEAAALRDILCGTRPVIVDAGALSLAAAASAPRILTPHAGEHAVLRRAIGLDPDVGGAQAAVETAVALGAVVVLKGAVTTVAAPDGWMAQVHAPTSWLAAAGTGDVLAGAMGAIVAGVIASGARVALAECAATAVLLHGQAAEHASRMHAGGPLVALEVAESLARAVGDLWAP